MSSIPWERSSMQRGDIPNQIGPDKPPRGLEAGSTIDPVGSDNIAINDSPMGRWLSMPISQEEVGIMRSLPRPARDEFTRNVHEYIRQMGQEYGQGREAKK